MTHHTQQCSCCKSEVSGELYHLGFSDMEAVYCERCPNVLLIKDPDFYSKIGVAFPNLMAGDKGWQEYDKHLLPYFAETEKHFPLCSCGAHFRYMAAPRCPKCHNYILGKGYGDKPVYRNARYVFVTNESIYI
ncbi:hypothetical protein [Atopomonas sediminilitoris]|uniref:hypothetical protein n=1 Tax=Atopomonas sediminilitoris TaxID=2919919 RepID=UPI001F4EEC16|nr:hypothetical protein [Atopomonas sediminilitoris]MCJ8169300.1 hypothetical protein [Atopomonas sediminilitoris]